MPEVYNIPRPEEFDDYIYSGVWERLDEPSFRRIKWTLSSFNAFLVVAVLTSLFTWAQTSCWRLATYILSRWKRRIRLEGSETPDYLAQLSQIEAIRSLVQRLWKKIWRQTRPSPLCRTNSQMSNIPSSSAFHQEDDLFSPWFGSVAVINALLFIIMGLFAPVLLSEGMFSPPIVKSRAVGDCTNASISRIQHREYPYKQSDYNPLVRKMYLMVEKRFRKTRSDDVFRLCRDIFDAGCGEQHYLSKPHITNRTLDVCPFKGDICRNNTVFEITHWNMSLFEAGINSPSTVIHNHRLTCAPVNLDPFLLRHSTSRGIVTVLNQMPEDGKFHPNMSLLLDTLNGPNKFSKDRSGWQMYQSQKRRTDFTVLPDYQTRNGWYGDPPKIHSLLERADGLSFLAIYRAGWTARYRNPVDDPLFSAHIPIPGQVSYMPDHEAEALGCFEQFQTCGPLKGRGQFCTKWSKALEHKGDLVIEMLKDYADEISQTMNDLDDQLEAIKKFLYHRENQATWAFGELQNFPIREFSVYDYIAFRALFSPHVPLVYQQEQTLPEQYVSTKQWMLEVETWLMKAYLTGIFTVQDDVIIPTPNGFANASAKEFNQRWHRCGRILLHNKNYVNINWIGFWTTVSTLIMLILLSHYVAGIHQKFVHLKSGLRRYIAQIFGSTVRNTLWGRIRHPRWFGRPTTFAHALELVNSVNRIRSWQREGWNLGSVGQSNHEANRHEAEEVDFEPDNPI